MGVIRHASMKDQSKNVDTIGDSWFIAYLTFIVGQFKLLS